MADLQNYIDNLKNLRVVMAVGLEHIQQNRDAFIAESNNEQLLAFGRLVSQIRNIAAQMEREFNTTEYLFAKRRDLGETA
jgi:hypothetical protein